MGISKTEGLTAEQIELAAIAKALGHPARIAILHFLMRVDKCICGDIVNELPLAQPTISQHLKELKSVGLIKGNIEGNAICYCVNHVTVTRFLSAMGLFNAKKKTKSTCC